MKMIKIGIKIISQMKKWAKNHFSLFHPQKLPELAEKLALRPLTVAVESFTDYLNDMILRVLSEEVYRIFSERTPKTVLCNQP